MKLVLEYFDMSAAALSDGASANKLIALPVRERIGRIKYVPEDKVGAEYAAIKEELEKEIEQTKSTDEEI